MERFLLYYTMIADAPDQPCKEMCSTELLPSSPAAYVFVQSPGTSIPFSSALNEGVARNHDTVMDLWVYRITSVARNHIGLLAAAAICTTGILARRREESIVISR